MPDFNGNWIEIFRAGDYGDKGQWSESDIDKVVANFAAGAWKPPAVLGHPKTDGPAMGWVESLARQGKTLVAKFSQVQPELEAQVKNGRFPNRSAAFYTDPQGKGPVLRHVGFLGAMPPEVKGLTPIKFSSEQFTSIDFQEEKQMPEKTFSEQFKEAFRELLGMKPAEPTFAEGQVSKMVSDAVKEATTELTKQFGEQTKALTTQITNLTTQLSSNDTAAKKAKAVAFVEKLKAAGKWLPAWTAAGVPAVLEQLAVSGATVKFGEAGKETEMSAFDQMCAFYEGLPAQVPGGDITGRRKSASGKVVPFNEAKGVDLDMDSVAFDERVKQIAAEKHIGYVDAFNIAVSEQSA